MGGRPRRRRLAPAVAALAVACLMAAGCSGGEPRAEPAPSAPTPTPATVDRDCGTVRIAYDPSNGYEASAFIVGTIAAEQLDCKVEYVKTGSREAWRLVAGGQADVYLDAYGSEDLRERLSGEGRPVTVIGPNGVQGGVDLLAPAFMAQAGLTAAPDLEDVEDIGWGITTPAITTVPALLALARAFVDFQQLDDYAVRNYDEVGPESGMSGLFQQASEDDERAAPNLYLAEGPRALLGTSPRQGSVQVPESAASTCEPDGRTTLCSLADFGYEKIVNSQFAESGGPAYALVFKYRLNREDAATILELVQLSGYDVGEPDVASWLNTHQESWRRWLR